MNGRRFRWIEPVKESLIAFFLHPSFILFFLGFLLGRAVLFSEIAPFAVAYFAIIYFMQRERLPSTFLGIMAGSLFSTIPHLVETVVPVLLFLGMAKLLSSFHKDDVTYAPFLAFFSSILGRGGLAFVTNQAQGSDIWVMIIVEAVLALVLTFIFHQSIPVLLHRQYASPLKQEELISLLILFASGMTGTVGWFVDLYSLEHIFSRYLILLLALAGGGTIGATVGVLTGLILSLASIQALTQMSLLGFSGLLAGLFREGKKAGVALGFILGSSILTVYTGGKETMWISFIETFMAILLFLFTPKALIEEMAKLIPGTKAYKEQEALRLGRSRELTSERVLQFSDLFRQLSNSFAQTSEAPEQLKEMKTDYFLSAVTDHTCQRCWKKDYCWTKRFDFTYENMKGMVALLEEDHLIHKVKLSPQWRNTCVKIDQMIQVMEGEYEKKVQEERLNRRIKEARLLVADQLKGVASVMRDFALEVKKEMNDLSHQEERIVKALEGMGLKIQRVDVLRLEKGNVEIEILHPTCNGRKECEKLIAPLLTDVLGENIVVKEGGCRISEGGCLMHLVSGKRYQVEVGMAQAAKGGGILSGDSYVNLDLGNGKYAIAVSDGMGNGQRAFTESNATVEMLKQILKSGLDEGLAIKTVNSILSLRSTDEVFATVDLVLIDLESAMAKFLKIGSSPSFIKRGEKVKMVSAHNLPIGILDEIDVEVVTEKLHPGDLLIMMTDGVYEANRSVENRDMWFKRMIGELQTNKPQEVADLLLERMIRVMNYEIPDDMTIVVAAVDHFRPKWSAIPIPEFLKAERELAR